MTSRTYAHAAGEHREATLAALADFVARAGGVDGAAGRRGECEKAVIDCLGRVGAARNDVPMAGVRGRDGASVVAGPRRLVEIDTELASVVLRGAHAA